MNNENKSKITESEVTTEGTSDEKLVLNLEGNPGCQNNDLYMEMLEFLIDKKQARHQDVKFYLSLRDHFFNKGFLSRKQREYVVKGLAELLDIKYFVPKKVT